MRRERASLPCSPNWVPRRRQRSVVNRLRVITHYDLLTDLTRGRLEGVRCGLHLSSDDCDTMGMDLFVLGDCVSDELGFYVMSDKHPLPDLDDPL